MYLYIYINISTCMTPWLDKKNIKNKTNARFGAFGVYWSIIYSRSQDNVFAIFHLPDFHSQQPLTRCMPLQSNDSSERKKLLTRTNTKVFMLIRMKRLLYVSKINFQTTLRMKLYFFRVLVSADLRRKHAPLFNCSNQF